MLIASLACSVGAFAPSSNAPRLATNLAMAKFDKSTERWSATTEDEKTGGYNAFGTLMR